MEDRKTVGVDELGRELREWSGTEPAISEVELRRILRTRIEGHRRTPRLRVAVVAAAASAIAVFVALQSARHPPTPPAASPEVVYETGGNVILVLREDGPPIYVVKDVLETGGEVP